MPGIQPTEQELRAFVGSRADYYLDKWEDALAGEGRVRGVNWAAFWLSGLWFSYRRMYRPALIVYGLMLAVVITEEALSIGMDAGEDSSPLSSLLILVVAVICGMNGNRWYLSHASKKIAEARSLALPEGQHLEILSKHGGTSRRAALGLWVLVLVVSTAVLLVLEVVLGAGTGP